METSRHEPQPLTIAQEREIVAANLRARGAHEVRTFKSLELNKLLNGLEELTNEYNRSLSQSKESVLRINQGPLSQVRTVSGVVSAVCQSEQGGGLCEYHQNDFLSVEKKTVEDFSIERAQVFQAVHGDDLNQELDVWLELEPTEKNGCEHPLVAKLSEVTFGF